MQSSLGERQQELLQLLLKNRDGLTIDELSTALAITRTATQQHLAILSRLQFVEEGSLLSTGGRPRRSYRLSPQGYEWFPKQYSWFSEVLLQNLQEKVGPESLKEMLAKMGEDLGRQHAEGLSGETPRARLKKTVELMDKLSYEAKLVETPNPSDLPAIEAKNCVYHHLAKTFPQVCAFDLGLLSQMSGAAVTHEECIVRGDAKCRFAFKK